jgi:hypothetical protein
LPSVYTSPWKNRSWLFYGAGFSATRVDQGLRNAPTLFLFQNKQFGMMSAKNAIRSAGLKDKNRLPLRNNSCGFCQ